METAPRQQGIVITLDGRISSVRLDGGPAGGAGTALACELRAALRARRTRTSRLAVGDRVMVDRTGDLTGMIEEILPRKTQLARGRGKLSREEHVIAANVDQLVVVAAIKEPDWRPGFVDRMLCAAEKGGLAAIVVANKLDLVPPPRKGEGEGAPPVEERFRKDLAVYQRLGYGAITASGVTGSGLDELRAALAGKVSVIAGQSGVGKSTLLNALEPGLGIRTRTVARETGKGKHTTTSTTLIPLSFGGYVLDTPGVRSFALFQLLPSEAGWLFQEIAALAPSCRFNDCLHQRQEPGCAVRAAVERGEIDARRFESYRRVLDSTGEDVEDDRG